MVQDLLLANARPHEPDVAFVVEPPPLPVLLLRPAVRYPGGDWWPSPVASLWLPDDLRRAAAWWAAAADPSSPQSELPRWLAEPAVGFLVLDRGRDGSVAVDLCWREHPDAARPVMTRAGSSPRRGDARYGYVTVDLAPASLVACALGWRALADRWGGGPAGR